MTSLVADPVITAATVTEAPCGGKAESLLRIRSLVAVPDFLVVPASWFTLAAAAELAAIESTWSQWDTVHDKRDGAYRLLRDVRLTPAMRQALASAVSTALPTSNAFAVRSSAVGEDGGRRSFAGLYDSVLDVAEADLEDAVLTCWRSWFAAGALACRDEGAWSPPTMAVVVQRMVSASQAGVAAVYGDTIEIEAVPGCGAGLVEGTATPARSVYSTPPRQPQSPVEHAAALAAHLHDTLALGDLDVEWAADADGQVWIVQARRLTTRPPGAPPMTVAGSSAEPTLTVAELYAAAAPHTVVPLGAVAEVVEHYRSKRQPLFAVGAAHDCDLGAALVVHFNRLGLATPAFLSMIGGLGLTVLLDVSSQHRQQILSTGDLHDFLTDLCAGAGEDLHTVVIREFIAGDCGVLSSVADDGVRVEFSTAGLLALNRGFAATEEFTIPHDGAAAAVPTGWSPTAVAVIDAVTRHFCAQRGSAVVEWVLRAQRPVLVDYSRLSRDASPPGTVHSGTVISAGACRGPAVVIDAQSAQALTTHSVAPVVSVAGPLPDPAHAGVADLHAIISGLAEPAVIVVDHPYAVLAALIPFVAGFVFTTRASRLCHLAILLRENGIPALCAPDLVLPEPGGPVELTHDGHLVLGVSE